MVRKIVLSLAAILSVVGMALAQNKQVSGTVTDTKGSPVPGATVVVDGTTIGTSTDAEGKYTLDAPVDGTLAVSSIGYSEQKVAINGKTLVNVVLAEAAHALDDVIVTAYGEAKREAFTGSAVQVKAEDIVKSQHTNAIDALNGKVPGLQLVNATGQPGSTSTIVIRGISSIEAGTSPLIIIDGMSFAGSINDINPADIESMSVLKDASSTSIYGARAANGVIVITTKRGKEGRPIVNFSTKLTYNPSANIDRLNLLNANEKVDLELDLLNSPYDYRQHKGGVANILDELGEYQAYKDNGWNGLSDNAKQRINKLRTINTDWNDVLFRDVFNQEYNVSMSGGSDRAHYYASAGYYQEQGTVKGVENDRFNMTLKTDFKINKLLKVGASIFSNQRNQKSYMTDAAGFTNPVYYSRMANPYFEPYDAEGNYIYDTNVQGRESEVPDFNVFEERKNTSKNRKDRSLMAIFDAELKFNNNLKLTTQYGLQHDNYTLKRYAGHNSYAMRKEKEYATFIIDGVKKSIFPDGGMNKQTESNTDQWTWKAMLEWNNRFNDIHDVELMGGTELRHTETELLTSAAYGYDNRTLTAFVTNPHFEVFCCEYNFGF